LSELFAYIGDFVNASKEIDIAEKINEKFRKEAKCTVLISQFLRFRTNIYLLTKRPKLAERSARLALKLARTENVAESEIIRTELYLGKAIIANLPKKPAQRFKLLEEAEALLQRATMSCRSINLVEQEPDILLAWAILHKAEGNIKQAKIHANEALYLANRCEYKLKQADIHNFIAYIAKNENDSLTTKEHATLALEIARCNGSSLSYKPAMDIAIELLKGL
jgi:hypothetical protein